MQRLFKTEYAPGGKVTKWYSHPDGSITRKTTQSVSGVKKAIHAHAETARGKDRYYMGSVPETVALQWCKEMGPGYTFLSREFAQYARKKLADGDYRHLSTGLR